MKLVGEVMRLGLSGADAVAALPASSLCRIYNGIGPGFLPDAVREKLTDALSLFEPAALVHDVRFEASDGSVGGFEAANEEFRLNCKRLAEDAYPWWNWRRYRAYAVARLLYRAVSSEAGWLVWLRSYADHGGRAS